jgi:ribosome-associated toxin RatA of RatAB toxin-antitoxin module
MREVRIEAHVGGTGPDELYRLIKDFARYPELTEGVHRVDVEELADGRARSSWEVAFREGVLRWTEEDRFFDSERRIEFREVEGDMQSFDGVWEITDAPEGSVVTFSASFDLGMASLGDLVEPIAERILRENFDSMLDGLTGGRSETVAVEPGGSRS